MADLLMIGLGVDTRRLRDFRYGHSYAALHRSHRQYGSL